MRGDILVIQEYHKEAASEAVPLLLPHINKNSGKFLLGISGESGAGKSEIAETIAEQLGHEGYLCCIIQQDDYFVFPPKTNARQREKDIEWVGAQEVRLNVLDQNLEDIKKGAIKITKPLVIFEEDIIEEEVIEVEAYDVIIVEGTYVSLLQNLDCRIFIDRDLKDTKQARLERNREKQDGFLEKILLIEHEIISQHKKLADIIVNKNFSAKNNK
jgi:uridine kinase